MSTKARDVMWGRQGGRWAPPPSGPALEAIHRVRLAALAAGMWPTESVERWRAIARDAEGVADGDLTVTQRRAREVVEIAGP